jgi:hypothetical protein
MLKIVWVEDNAVKIPDYVHCVPFLLTNTGHRYTNDDLFWFISSILPNQTQGQPQQQQQQVAQRYDPQPPQMQRPVPQQLRQQQHYEAQEPDPEPMATFGMEANFSDSFAFLDDNSQRYTQQADVMSDFQSIQTPKNDQSRRSDDTSLDKLMMQRERDLQNILKPQ